MQASQYVFIIKRTQECQGNPSGAEIKDKPKVLDRIGGWKPKSAEGRVIISTPPPQKKKYPKSGVKWGIKEEEESEEHLDDWNKAESSRAESRARRTVRQPAQDPQVRQRNISTPIQSVSVSEGGEAEAFKARSV